MNYNRYLKWIYLYYIGGLNQMSSLTFKTFTFIIYIAGNL